MSSQLHHHCKLIKRLKCDSGGLRPQCTHDKAVCSICSGSSFPDIEKGLDNLYYAFWFHFDMWHYMDSTQTWYLRYRLMKDFFLGFSPIRPNRHWTRIPGWTLFILSPAHTRNFTWSFPRILHLWSESNLILTVLTWYVLHSCQHSHPWHYRMFSIETTLTIQNKLCSQDLMMYYQARVYRSFPDWFI